MNETTIEVDQADEEILTSTVSDEALEAAAGTASRGLTFQPHDPYPLGPC